MTSGTLMPPKVTRPYVYRGTGEDQFPETTPLPPPAEPKGLTAEEYKTREKERKKEVARMKRAAAKRRLRYCRPVVDIEDISTWGNRKPKPVYLDHLDIEPFKPEPEPVYLDRIEVEPEPEPEPKPWVPPRRPARPAPGWQPLAGADLDSLLDELE